MSDQLLYTGELAEIGENKPAILKLARIDPLLVKAVLPIAMYRSVKVGMHAQITSELPGTEDHFGATIANVDKVIDAASGTFEVRMNIANAAGEIPAGVKCRALIAE